MIRNNLMTVSGGPFEAEGGTEGTYTQSGKNYKKHTFTATGTLRVKGSSGVCDVLLIAAGGGGGSTFTGNYNATAGAGAGGMLETSTYTIPVGTHIITIGGGGPCPQDGGDTSLGALLVATGGGAGAYHDYSPGGSARYTGRDGGSGGGGTNQRGGGSGIAGQGYAGYNTSHHAGWWSGGGGGAGGAGTQSGGAQRSNDWSGSSVSYCRGGEGGADGGGGAGGNNSGDGGDGKGQNGQPPFYIGGTGGSGYAIIRYEVE